MKIIKVLTTLVIVLALASPALAVTNTSTKSGNWSDTTVWGQGHVPLAGEDVVIATTHSVAVDVGVSGRIPATSGTLNSLSAAAAGTGTITIDMTVQNLEIDATTFQAAAHTTGLIQLSGAAPTKTLTLVGNLIGGTGATNPACLSKGTSTCIVNITGNVTGGSGTSAWGITDGSTAGLVTITGTVTGGSGSAAFGYRKINQNPVTINGSIVGGTGVAAAGVSTAGFASTITLNNGNFIDGTGSTAYAGYPPVLNISASNYIKKGSIYFAQELLPSQVKAGVVNGTVTGTYAPSFTYGVSP